MLESTHAKTFVKQALILDFGEVLVRPQPAAIVAEMAALAGLTVPEFHRRYWAHRPAYDCGLPADQYWQRVLADSPAAPPTPRTIAALIDADARSWTDYRDVMWQLTADYRARGGKTAFLSNGIPEVMALVRSERRLPDFFDVVIVSYEVGFTKPDPRIYQLCLAQLGLSATEAVFVDDRVPNIEAAQKLGISTVWFRGDESVAEVARSIA